MVLQSKKSHKIIYLDIFAGAGLFPCNGESNLDRLGSPSIGLSIFEQVIADKRFDTTQKNFKAILFEIDEEICHSLLQNLKNIGFKENLYEIHNEDYSCQLNYILNRTFNTFTLAFLDPFNINLPFEVVKKILLSGNTDALIFFNAVQVQRYQGHPKGKDFTGKDKFIALMNNFFGDKNWIQIAEKASDGTIALELLTQHYINKLKEIGKLGIAFDLLYENQNKIQFKIIVCSKNIEIMLAAKELKVKIESFQSNLRERMLSDKKGQTFLIEPHIEEVIEEDEHNISMELYDKFKGNLVIGEEIYLWAYSKVSRNIFKSTLKKALTILKQQGKIDNPAGSKWNSWSKIRFL
jgi:three-Cys-motif partner protein